MEFQATQQPLKKMFWYRESWVMAGEGEGPCSISPRDGFISGNNARESRRRAMFLLLRERSKV